MLLLHRRILCRISSFSLQIPFRNSSPTKMNRGSRGGLRSQGRGSRPSGNLVFRIEPMMCLGLNWDPQTKYGRQRPGEDCETSDIPHEFDVLVQRAIWDAHALMKKNLEISNVEDTLPGMRPNICIVNFYTTSGRLGLHQDRDESRESIKRGLPVVSFSVGDSAEFLYGDDRNVDEAEKVILESGDVLIFGGESRLIFHGVSSIIPNSAPQALLQETNLRAGRLNLTFRQF